MNNQVFGNLLLSEPPLMCMPSLAVLFGNSDEAIILQQIHYWLLRSNNVEDGYKWVYNSMENWQKQFPWIQSPKTLRKYFRDLEKRGLLVTGNYNKKKFDRTKWYRIDYDAFSNLVNPLGKPYPTNGNNLPNGSGKLYRMDVAQFTQPIPETTQRLPESTSVDYLSQETAQDSHEEKDDLSSKGDWRDKKMEDIQAKILTTKIIDYFVDEYTKINNGENDFKPPMVTVNEAQKLMPISKKLIQAKLPNAEIYQKIDISLVKNGVDYYFGYMLSVLDNFAEQELRRKQNES